MIIGHQKQWEFLRKSAETGKISHAYLFSGPEKLGKKTLALQWISSLFEKDLQKSPHPDLALIEPQNPDFAPPTQMLRRASKASTGKKEIQIGQIRDLIWKLSLKPYSANFKAAVIDQAHAMNQEAQTCLLKTLEEPRGRAILILITEYPEELFPTILSRVQTIKFYPVRKEEIINYLKEEKVPREITEEIAGLSMGRPGRAIELISDIKSVELLHQKVKELVKISNSDISLRFQYAKLLSQDPQNLKDDLDIWLNYFRDILLRKMNGEQGSLRYSLSKLKNILKLIQNIKYLVSTTNANPRLALEILMLEI